MFVDIALDTAAAQSAASLVRLVLGALAGFVAAVVMGVPMGRQEGGFTPAYVAASVLRRTTPDEVSLRDATVVHHGAGMLAGVLYAFALIVGESVVPPVWSLGGVDLLSHLVAVGVVVGFIYGLFAHVVLPRAGGRIYEEQSTAVRGQWLRSSLVFGAALAVVAPFLQAFA
ncbi:MULTISPECIES: hypothetical protein [Haloprofundus]|uniref:hypothetical protein n=1 Tax=Haloprofundus TaxID=1911573 RepID=UPI000E444A83|nr:MULTISPECIES: hypothetical protein [Haloprofundus]QCJ46127.1 hypothetical protein FCF25_02890 [Haloprofundus sp. MHR1]